MSCVFLNSYFNALLSFFVFNQKPAACFAQQQCCFLVLFCAWPAGPFALGFWRRLVLVRVVLSPRRHILCAALPVETTRDLKLAIVSRCRLFGHRLPMRRRVLGHRFPKPLRLYLNGERLRDHEPLSSYFAVGVATQVTLRP